MKKRRFFLKAFLLLALLIAFDQYSKLLAIRYLYEQNPIEIIPGVFELHYLRNAGAAFGIFQNRQTFFLLTTVIVVLAIILLLYRLPEERKFSFLKWDLILLISGALGNFIDRAAQQYVTDFFYFKLIDFPIFNVADCYVCVAVFFLAVLLIFVYKDEDLDEIFAYVKGMKRES